MKKVLLLSVPHTGTIFLSDYFMDHLGLEFIPKYWDIDLVSRDDVFTRMHTNAPEDLYSMDQQKMIELFKLHYKVVVPLRHPKDNALSCIVRKHNNLSSCSQSWKVLLDMLPGIEEVFFVDVSINPEYRDNMMQHLSHFLERDPIDEKEYQKFITKWEKKNYETYDKDYSLLNTHRMDLLEPAIEWYKAKRAELEKLYSSPLPTD